MTPSSDLPLSRDEIAVLRQACDPIGLLVSLPADTVLLLRRLDYVETVFGGVQITPRGLERLVRENAAEKRRA